MRWRSTQGASPLQPAMFADQNPRPLSSAWRREKVSILLFDEEDRLVNDITARRDGQARRVEAAAEDRRACGLVTTTEVAVVLPAPSARRWCCARTLREASERAPSRRALRRSRRRRGSARGQVDALDLDVEVAPPGSLRKRARPVGVRPLIGAPARSDSMRSRPLLSGVGIGAGPGSGLGSGCWRTSRRRLFRPPDS